MGKIICPQCNNEFDDIFEICPVCGCLCSAPSKKDMSLAIGTLLQDRYIIEGVIGSGGFAIAYLAYDRVLDQNVALKEYFPTDLATRSSNYYDVCAYEGEKSLQFTSGLNRFADEALRLVQINHLNGIVRIFDSFFENDTAYIVMEYVEGTTAKELLKSKGPLSCKEVLDIVTPVLYALEEVHNNGIIHRDIAPDNIVIMPDGQVKLLDFGSARTALSAGSSIDYVVKRGYAPVEQYDIDGSQGPWTDIYSVAAVMYHLLTGKLPEESINRRENDTLIPPSKMGFKVPADVESAMMEALIIDPLKRPRSARQFADKLKPARDTLKPVKEKKEKVTNKRILIAVVAASLVAVCAIVGIFTSFNFSANDVGTTKIYVPSFKGLNYYSKEVDEKIDYINRQLKALNIDRTIDRDNIRPGKQIDKTKGYDYNAIYDQNPSKGECEVGKIIKYGISFTIIKPEKEYKLPNFSNCNKTYNDVFNWCKKHNINIQKLEVYHKKVSKGIIARQKPKAGKNVTVKPRQDGNRGDTVIVYVSKGPKPTQPPTTRYTTPPRSYQSPNNNNRRNNNNNNGDNPWEPRETPKTPKNHPQYPKEALNQK